MAARFNKALSPTFHRALSLTSKLENLSLDPPKSPGHNTAFNLRDYQHEAVNSVLSAIDSGMRRPAFVLATGGGKTVVFSHIIPKIPKLSSSRGEKVLVLAHKEELVFQAAKSISDINPHLKVEIDMANYKADFHGDVIVGSVPTLVRLSRLEKYNPMDFKAIILDECHHSSASSWTKILGYFNALEKNLDLIVIGCTATFERNDEQSLYDVFEKIVFERDLITMIANKELVDIKLSTVELDVNFSQLSTRNDDYTESLLSRVMNSPENNALIALAYKQLKRKYGFKSTMMFCAGKDHCKTICGVLQSEGINAQYVTGDTVKHERRSIIEDFRTGKIEVLCNVMVFTEGTDISNIDCIFLCRPTKSRTLLVQMLGRGLRLHEGKTHCHVVDIAGTRGTGMSIPLAFELPSGIDLEEKSLESLMKTQARTEEDYYEKALAELEKRDDDEFKRRTEEQMSISMVDQLRDQLKMEFHTYEGFLAVESHDISHYSIILNVTQTLRRDKLNWVGLEFNVWGHPFNREFILLELTEDDKGNKFTLYRALFPTSVHKKASDYKIKRILGKRVIIESHNLETILAKANSIVYSAIQGKFVANHLTDRQKMVINSMLKSTIEKKYGGRVEEFEQKVSEMSKIQGSLLIFALKYSIHSPHVKWVLRKCLCKTDDIEEDVKSEVERFLQPPSQLEKSVKTKPKAGKAAKSNMALKQLVNM